jgi:hypothetical protein
MDLARRLIHNYHFKSDTYHNVGKALQNELITVIPAIYLLDLRGGGLPYPYTISATHLLTIRWHHFIGIGGQPSQDEATLAPSHNNQSAIHADRKWRRILKQLKLG